MMKLDLYILVSVVAPEQLRALALVAEEDLQRGRNFMSGFLDLRASLAGSRDNRRQVM